MADPSVFDAIRIPAQTLIALDNRTYHFAMQPWHHILRLLHILSVSAFFGGIIVLDLRLMGIKTSSTLRSLASDIMSWLYSIFAISFVTGALLFFYDPVKIGSHAYFSPKIIFMFLALANAGFYNHIFYQTALEIKEPLPQSAKIAGTLSLMLWLGVMACASLNVEAAPKVLLR